MLFHSIENWSLALAVADRKVVVHFHIRLFPKAGLEEVLFEVGKVVGKDMSRDFHCLPVRILGNSGKIRVGKTLMGALALDWLSTCITCCCCTLPTCMLWRLLNFSISFHPGILGSQA